MIRVAILALAGLVGIGSVAIGQAQEAGDVAALLDALDSADVKVRTRAASDLAELGPKARAAVPRLTTMLGSDDKELRLAAAWALARIAPETEGLERVFLEALRTEDVNQKTAGAIGLAQVGCQDPSGIATLIKALEHWEDMVSGFAGEALARIGKPAVPGLVESLKHPNSRVRANAARALGKIGLAAREAIPAIIPLLDDRDRYVRQQAARALGGFAPEAKEVVEPLLKAIRANDYYMVGEAAAGSLSRFGPAVIPDLVDLLYDANAVHRKAALTAIGSMGPDAVPHLVRVLASQSQEVRVGVLLALSRIGQAAMPEFLRMLESDDIVLRRNAARTLGWGGGAGRVAVPQLLQALKSPDEQLRADAAFALGRLHAEDAVPALREALKDDSEDVWHKAKEALETMGRGEEARAVPRPARPPIVLPEGLPRRPGENCVLAESESNVTGVAFSRDGKLVLAAGGGVEAWEIATGREIRRFMGRAPLWDAEFLPDGRHVLSTGPDGARIWEVATGKEVSYFHPARVHISRLAVLPQGDRFLGAEGASGTVELWDVPSGRVLRSFPQPMDAVTSIAVSPDGRRAVCTGRNYHTTYPERRGFSGALLCVWDLETGETLFEFRPAVRTRVDDAVFTPDGQSVLSIDPSDRGCAAIWDVHTARKVRSFPQVTSVHRVALAPDGRRAVFATSDGLLHLFEIEPPRLVADLHSRAYGLRTMAFSPDGRWLLHGSKTIELWLLPEDPTR